METLNEKRSWCLQWNSRWIALYLLLFFLINLSFLTKFPIMHSDEAWLSGLTRTMMEQGTLNATEPFFTLKPRYPHGLKILFHLLQMPFSLLCGYRLFAFRLLSLLVSIAALWVFHKILCRYLPEPSFRFLCLTAFSLSAQYLYASHFARQEILILFLMLLVYLFLEQGKVGLAALFTGLSAGVHPNGFLIAVMAGGLFVSDLLFKRKKTLKKACLFAVIAGGVAGIFVAISLSFDPSFVPHYIQYGNSEFELFSPEYSRLQEIPGFFSRIYHSVSGTYYVPEIKVQLLLLLLAAASSPFFFRRERRLLRPWAGAAGVFSGIVLIGRFNQTSVVFLFPFLFLCLFLLIQCLGGRPIPGLSRPLPRTLALFALILLLTAESLANILPAATGPSYEGFLEALSRHVPRNEKTLANLNTGYYFERDCLIDYRNLAYLEENGLTPAEFLEKEEIQYVVYSDELDLIYDTRPKWNAIYGNPLFVPGLRKALAEDYTLVGRFTSSRYGGRIIGYIDERPFTLYIYRRNPSQ